MRIQIIYERSVNVLASSLAMVAQRLPFLKNLTPIFGTTGGIPMAAPLTVTFLGTHALSGQSLTIQPTSGSTDTETVAAGEQFSWSFKLSDERYDIRAFAAKTNGVADTLPEGLTFTNPLGAQSGIHFLFGTPTVPGQYTIEIIGYRFVTKVGDQTQPYTLNLTVEGDPTPFEEFAASFWQGEDLANPQIAGPTADPDQDGIDNQMEFILDLDPTKASATPGTFGIDPQDPTKIRYEIPLNSLANANVAAVTFEESSLLQNDWQEVPVQNVQRTEQSVILTAPKADRKFYRLKVSLN